MIRSCRLALLSSPSVKEANHISRDGALTIFAILAYAMLLIAIHGDYPNSFATDNKCRADTSWGGISPNES